MAFGPVRSSHERGISLNRHDAWNDRNGDPSLAALLYPRNEYICIVAHLGDHKRCYGVNLLFQMINEEIHVPMIVTSFRISSNTNIEMIPICVPYVFDQIPRIPEILIASLPFFLVSRRVSSKRQDIGTPCLKRILQCLIDLIFLHIRTCQMHASLKTVHHLSIPYHLACQL